MSALTVLTAYERLVDVLDRALSEEDWERLEEAQNRIEVLQQQFDALPETEKRQPDVQDRLRRILQKQTALTERVADAKETAALNLKKLKTAERQHRGYASRIPYSSVPPVLFDRKE